MRSQCNAAFCQLLLRMYIASSTGTTSYTHHDTQQRSYRTIRSIPVLLTYSYTLRLEDEDLLTRSPEPEETHIIQCQL